MSITLFNESKKVIRKEIEHSKKRRNWWKGKKRMEGSEKCEITVLLMSSKAECRFDFRLFLVIGKWHHGFFEI